MSTSLSCVDNSANFFTSCSTSAFTSLVLLLNSWCSLPSFFTSSAYLITSLLYFSMSSALLNFLAWSNLDCASNAFSDAFVIFPYNFSLSSARLVILSAQLPIESVMSFMANLIFALSAAVSAILFLSFDSPATPIITDDPNAAVCATVPANDDSAFLLEVVISPNEFLNLFSLFTSSPSKRFSPASLTEL